jgi:hypothetical protein
MINNTSDAIDSISATNYFLEAELVVGRCEKNAPNLSNFANSKSFDMTGLQIPQKSFTHKA